MGWTQHNKAMKLYATIENEKGKQEGVGSDNRLDFDIRIGNKKFAEGQLERRDKGVYLYFSTTLGQVGEGYDAIEDQCIDYYIADEDLKGKKQKGENTVGFYCDRHKPHTHENWTAKEIAEKGTPVCPICDEDMLPE
jgi:hypothetical protein